MKPATASSFSRARDRLAVDLLDRRQQQRPALGEQLVEHLVLGVEVVVDEPVGDAGLVGDVGHAAGVEALAREDPDRRVEDLAPPVDRRRLGHQRPRAPPRATRMRAGRRLASDGSEARIALLELDVEVGDDEALAVGRLREHDRPTGRRSSSGRRSRSAAAPRRPGWRATTNAWFSIARARSSTSQWSLPVSSVNAEGTVITVAPRDGEDPVELREAQVVADGQPERRRPGAPRRADDLVAGLLVVGLAIGDPADVDVEHVDLAVAASSSPSGPIRDGGVEEPSPAPRRAPRCCRRSDGCPARAPRPGRRRSSGRRAARLPRSWVAESPSRFHFSGSTASSAPSAAAARTRRSAASTLRALSPVELSCMAAARISGVTGRLTSQSEQYRFAPGRGCRRAGVAARRTGRCIPDAGTADDFAGRATRSSRGPRSGVRSASAPRSTARAPSGPGAGSSSCWP